MPHPVYVTYRPTSNVSCGEVWEVDISDANKYVAREKLHFLINDYYIVSKKTGLFSFKHNFAKCCLILIILSLLQTEIKDDQEYPKIYHYTSNLLVYGQNQHCQFTKCIQNALL